MTQLGKPDAPLAYSLRGTSAVGIDARQDVQQFHLDNPLSASAFERDISASKIFL
jgi:hypothetical protein